MWACGLCLSLSLLRIFSLFSAITKNSSLSLFHSVCLTLITVSWQVLAHWVVDRPMSASSAWISFEILTHNPHLPPRSPALSLSLCVLSALSLSFSYRTLSPTANLAGILPLSPTWSTRLCPVEVCHCPVIKTQTFHLPDSVQWTAAFLTNALNASTSVMERIVISLDNVHTFWGTAWTEMSVGWEIIEFTSLPLGAAGQTFSIKHFLHAFEECCLLFSLPVLMNVRLQFINDKLT